MTSMHQAYADLMSEMYEWKRRALAAEARVRDRLKIEAERNEARAELARLKARSCEVAVGCLRQRGHERPCCLIPGCGHLAKAPARCDERHPYYADICCSAARDHVGTHSRVIRERLYTWLP